MDDLPEDSFAQHVYDLAKLDRAPQGPTSLEVTTRRRLAGATLPTGSSSAAGAVLTGRRIVCTLEGVAAGTGAAAHSQPGEQFNYILYGTMMSDIAGDRVFASRGAIVHTPGGAVHTAVACPDEDLLFFAIRDTRDGSVGPPIDDGYAGLHCFPAFGSRADEPRLGAADVIERSNALPPGPGKRYVYDMRDVRETARSPASAEVTPDDALHLPPGVTGKMLSGERLHVGVLRLEAGSRLSNYRRDNEQIVFVAEGEIEALVDDEPLEVGRHCVLHIPPAMRHELAAPHGALVVIAQDQGEPE
jgi:quercetin dioxygenase-like cupin family protein